MQIINLDRKQILNSVILLLIGLSLTCLFSAAAHAMDKNETFKKAQQQAVKWLAEQMVPNSIVPKPAPYRRNLILSYRIPKKDPVYRYLYGRSFIYDNALAVIAFSIAGDYRKAEFILNALNRLLLADGSLWFSYNAHNSWPSTQDHAGAIKRLGAITWVGYSIVYYLGKRLEKDSSFLDQDPLAIRYVAMAKKIIDFAISRQVKSPVDKRYGLITGGDATYSVTPSDDFTSINEEYAPDLVNWVSTEHNIDAYFFIRDLGRLLGNSQYLELSEKIKKGLISIWSEDDNQFYRGIKENQSIDPYLPLDTASWGALFLLSFGEHKKANQCLKATDNFFNISNGIEGYAPYYKETVHENENVNRFYYRTRPETTWSDIGLVWAEGSLGVAVAYLRAGNPIKASGILNAMMAMRERGGFQYASMEIPYQFNKFHSVASTAWFVIANEIYLNNETLFWGK